MTRDTFDHFQPRERGLFGENESTSIRGNASVRSNLLDLDLVLHHETEKAIKVSLDGTEARAVWLPKRPLEIFRGKIITNASRRSGQRITLPVITVTLPEPLAKEKGLI